MSPMDRVGPALSIVEVLGRGARNEDSGFHLSNKQNTRQIQAHAKDGQNRYTPRNISLYSPPTPSTTSTGDAPYLPRLYHAYISFELQTKQISRFLLLGIQLLRSAASAPALHEEAHDRASRSVVAVVPHVCDKIT